MKELYPRLGFFRQPICWSAIRVFDPENEDDLKLGKNSSFKDFYRTKGNYSDETFMEMLHTMNEVIKHLSPEGAANSEKRVGI